MAKNLTPVIFRPLLWMVPGFAFTVFAYWYPTWVDRSIPKEDDSRIWMIVAFMMRDTFWAAVTVTIAFGVLVYVAFRNRNHWSVLATVLAVLMFLPSVWLIVNIGSAWLSYHGD